MEPSSTGRAPGRAYRGIAAGERVAARRRALLDAGRELYGTRGAGGVTVKDVCRAAGLTDRYFYESFRDGETFFLAVFDDACELLFAEVAAAVAAAPPTGEDRLRAAVATFLGRLAADPRIARLVFSEAAIPTAAAERHMRETLRRFAALVAATARDSLPAAIPDRLICLLSLSLVGTLERVVIEWQEGALTTPVDELVDDCVELFLALFAGLAARAG